MSFPDEHSLCETCGYELRGLTADAMCPECGTAVRESDPAVRRKGLEFQRHLTPRTFFQTYRDLLIRPRSVFRALRLDAGLSHELGFLLVSLAIASLLFQAVNWSGLILVPWWFALGFAVLSTLAILGDSIGTGILMRMKKWRVDPQLSRRVVCLASAAWFPVALAFAFVMWAFQHGWQRPLEKMFPNGFYFFSAAVMILSMLGYEMLKYSGMRSVRYGNRESAGSNQNADAKNKAA